MLLISIFLPELDNADAKLAAYAANFSDCIAALMPPLGRDGVGGGTPSKCKEFNMKHVRDEPNSK